MKEETKGLTLAVILSVAVIYATNLLFPHKAPAPAPQANQKIEIAEPLTAEQVVIDENPLTSEEAAALDRRIAIENDALKGSLRLKGARFDELYLRKYKETMAADSANIELFSPGGTKNPYYSEFGWLSADKSLKLPDSDTVWSVKGSKLTPETPLVLEWNNGQGLKFVRKISMDKNYMFFIEQTVENNSGKNITLYPYGLISKSNLGRDESRSVVHEGAIGVVNSKLEEIKYGSLKDGKKKEFESNGGWAGFSDKYWFSSFILDNNSEAKIKFANTGDKLYQADFVGAAQTIAPGSVGTQNLKMFAGAKEIKLLDSYTKQYNIDKFDLAVDFGWYYFLTKPFFYILDFLYNFIGNMGWAILLFAALLRLAMFPIANKSYESMSKMKKVQPKMQELQEKYKDDKVKMQQKVMALYRKEKINPAAGCLPVLLQIPVFFSLYKVLNISIEIRHAPFIGWIKDLSAPDPLTLSVITHLPIPSLLDIGVWPILMGLTMYIQQKLNPAPTNKDQARMFAMMPLIFTFMLGHFASGLVIYWTLSNILSIIQQRVIMKKIGV